MDKSFQKADSGNLPKVDGGMVADFFACNPNFFGPELRNVKSTRATRGEYGDNAVGYVQLKKEANVCLIKAKMTPEHKIRSTAYVVEATINLKKEEVTSIVCKGCAASQGGCKHAIAFLLWLHRKSEEPSPTSVQCYWKKSSLSDLQKCNVPISILFGKNKKPLGAKQAKYAQELVDNVVQEVNGGIFDILKGPPVKESLSVWQICLDYNETLAKKGKPGNCDELITVMSNKMTVDLCSDVENDTRGQSKESLWYEFRFGRITASKVWEASRCGTLDGSLTEAIMGASTVPETPMITRGKTLEPLVIAEVEKTRNIKIRNCGLYLSKDFPCFGASPDGVTETYCIEVKCPSNENTMKNYLNGGKIAEKYSAQLQMQMLFAQRKRGFFCVASPDFEKTKKVKIVEVKLNKKKIVGVLRAAQLFWKKAIFPVLIHNTR